MQSAKDAARQFIARIFEVTEPLKHHPKMGREVPEAKITLPVL